MISSVFYLFSCIIDVLIPLPGLYTLYSSKKDQLIRGGFVFFTCLNLASWLIYGFLSNKLQYSNPLFLGLFVFYLLLSLILLQEYANIVYHNVILINFSWWLRQQKLELIAKMCHFTAFLALLLPQINTLYYCIRRKNTEFVDYKLISAHFLSASLYFSYCVTQKFWSLAAFAVFKAILVIVLVIARRRVEKLQKIQEKIKKME